MAAVPGLDGEFMQYWLKLSLAQKESLLSVAKNFVGLQDETNVTDLRKKLIQEERQKYLQGESKSFSWQEVKNMALNKDQASGNILTGITINLFGKVKLIGSLT